MPSLPPHKICPQCGQPAVLTMAVCQRCGYPYNAPMVVPVIVPVPVVPPGFRVRRRRSVFGQIFLLFRLAVLAVLAWYGYRWYDAHYNTFLGAWSYRERNERLEFEARGGLTVEQANPASGESVTKEGNWMESKNHDLTFTIDNGDAQTFTWKIRNGDELVLTPEGKGPEIVLHRVASDWHPH